MIFARPLGNSIRSAFVPMGFTTAGTVVLIVFLSGCAPAKPAALIVPQALTSVRIYSGTPLSGPRPVAAPIVQAQDAYSVRVEIVALERIPAGMLEPLATHAKLISVDRGGSPVLSVPKLSVGARMGSQGQLASLGGVAAGIRLSRSHRIGSFAFGFGVASGDHREF